MLIRGAVLESIGAQRPYADSRPITIGELELDPPGPGELLVQVEAAGLCHSDLSVVDGNRVRPVPMLLGHEAAGRVVEAAPRDDGPGRAARRHDLPAALRRVQRLRHRRARALHPGHAANNAGHLIGDAQRLHRDGADIFHHLGVSGFADHAVVHETSVVPVADDVPAEVAAVLGCAVLTGGGAVLNAGRPTPGQTVAVVGLGGVGMAAVLTALAQDGVRVVGIDTLPDKLEAARRLGAHDAFTPDQAVEQGLRAEVVIECVGRARAFEAAIELTAPGGRTVTVGLPAPDDTATVSPLALVAQGRTIIGSYLGSAVPSRDIPVFADLWRAGRLPVEHLVSSHITLDEINAGMDELAEGRAIRQVITFG